MTKREELLHLIRSSDERMLLELKENAMAIRDREYGKILYLRALIEISSYCVQNCYYCGLRRDNSNALRYRLTKDQILSSVNAAYNEGIKTIVLQGGEDPYFSDTLLEEIIKEILSSFDVRVTLSLGERTRDSYERLFKAGARRYLLRHESISKEHYKMLHPESQTLENRLKCLAELKKIGFQAGCGFMVGSPYQMEENIVEDLLFIERFKPHMVGIGPFVSASNTPFESFPNGSATLTLKLLALIRIMNPKVLLPSTTALATVMKDGEIEGLDWGANVIMPNFTPQSERRKYTIYDNKANSGLEAGENVKRLKEKAKERGYLVSSDFGDSKII